MTLLISVFAAVCFTVAWYKNQPQNTLCLSTPCFLLWGASLMWLVDAVVEYAHLGVAYFSPEAADLVNDAFLGLSVLALTLVVWVVTLLVKDPRGVLHNKK
ncbi:MAG: hypothetical protein LBN05_05040 [Oscillospiraceae bacterium]|nr:hypothetical protein [Oscillospiraceae bacterium]